MTTCVVFRIGRAYGGRRWLKPRFPATADWLPGVDIDVGVDAGPKAGIGEISVRPVVPSEPDCCNVRCEVRLPRRWFEDGFPQDGLLSLKIMNAFLDGLDQVGRVFDLGPLPLRSAKNDRGRESDLYRLFQSRVQDESEARAEREFVAAFDAVAPGGLVVAGRADVSPRWRERQERVVRALDATQASDRDTGGALIWTASTQP